MAIIRQGDVILISDATIPAAARPVSRQNGRVVLAAGERTGHHHVIDSPDVTLLQTDLDELADRFLIVERECALTHEEHPAHTLSPGAYVVRRHREYTSRDMPPRLVAD